MRFDPKVIAAARELRDRWLEQFHPVPMIANARYQLSRAALASETPSPVLPRLAA